MIKTTALITFLYVLALSAALYFWMGSAAAISCFVGGIIMVANVGGLYFAWSRIFANSSIGLTLIAIVSKYILFGLLFWALAKTPWVHPVGLIIGLSTLVIAILSMTASKSFARKSPSKQ